MQFRIQFKWWQFQFNSNSTRTGSSQFNSNSGIGLGINKKLQFRSGIDPGSGGCYAIDVFILLAFLYWHCPLYQNRRASSRFYRHFGIRLLSRFAFSRCPRGHNFRSWRRCVLVMAWAVGHGALANYYYPVSPLKTGRLPMQCAVLKISTHTPYTPQ